MPMIQTDSQHYSDIADAIREKTLSSTTFYPQDMASGIRSIEQFAPIIYSLDEREVGVWTDGKPLYEKTYEFSFSDIHGGSQSSSEISGQLFLDQLDYDMVKIKDGYITPNNSSTTSILTTPINYPQGSYFIRTNVQHASNINDDYPYVYLQLTYSVSSFYNNREHLKFIITIQYTKTTDTPGSGSWTTGGVPAHHYSTDEQVIGTWIDGSTIYEKTWDFGSDLVLNSNTWTNTVIKVSDFRINKITRAEILDSIGTYMGYIGASCDNQYVRLLQTRSINIDCRIVTLQYTKSS